MPLIATIAERTDCLDFGLLIELDNNRYFEQTAQQTSVDVQPMQTYYNFTCGPVDLNLKFTAPLFMDNLDLIVTSGQLYFL